MAKDQADLERPGAAIMKDCTFDDGLVVRTIEARGYKIGAAGANAAGFLAADARRADEAAKTAEDEAVQGHPKGCGCVAAGLGGESLLGGAALLGLGALVATRRQRRASSPGR